MIITGRNPVAWKHDVGIPFDCYSYSSYSIVVNRRFDASLNALLTGTMTNAAVVSLISINCAWSPRYVPFSTHWFLVQNRKLITIVGILLFISFDFIPFSFFPFFFFTDQFCLLSDDSHYIAPDHQQHLFVTLQVLLHLSCLHVLMLAKICHMFNLVIEPHRIS